jgi:serine/threonine-protein kinase
VGHASGTRAPLRGYELGAVIGQGGMGEVVAARDPKIGREVAIKRMKATSPTPTDIERFLREAKIQARLAHPAIVPVHELGHDSDGLPYFTMKRLAGTTMAEVLVHGGQQQRLVRAFVDVSLAIERAHSRHVVHRDLKPANIMLGDYGEVYVLDWGIARIVGEPEEGNCSDTHTPEGLTQAGVVLGTPGYMAPETARAKAVGPAADIYALGSILFEILTGTPLHPRGMAAVASTLETPTVAPASRAPDRTIPPELDAACVAALSSDPAARPTARQLAESIQRYLDGDRDLERRRELAAVFLAQAKAATDHADQMQLAGRALALDPKSQEAATLVTRLMLEPADEIPPELAGMIVQSDLEDERQSAGLGMALLAAYFGFLPVLLWMGVTNVALLVSSYALIACMIALLKLHRRALNAGRTFNVFPSLVGNVVIAGLTSRIFGTFALTPVILAGVAVVMIALPQMQRRPGAILPICCLGFVAPLLLEAAGVIGSTWQVQEGVITFHSTSFRLGGMATQAMLIGGPLFGIVAIGLFSRAMAISRREAIHQLQLQTWRLKQLVPESVRE